MTIIQAGQSFSLSVCVHQSELKLNVPTMRSTHNLFDRFDRLDTSINKWLVANSVKLLRFSMGLVFFGFGILKFFSGISPIESLATRTTTALTLGAFAGHNAMLFVAALECIIGICFLTGMLLRVGVWLMAFQMIGAMSPLLLYPSEFFPARYMRQPWRRSTLSKILF